MNSAINTIEQSLATAQSPVVLSSFGKDSMLLLWMVRQINPNVPVVWFHDARDVFAESVIKEWDLTVMSYRPADRYLVPGGDGVMLVDEYSVGASRLPVLRDVVAGDGCDLESLPSARTPTFNYPFDVTLFGFKAIDAKEHFVTGNTVLPKQFTLGHTQMVAPLYDWDDAGVLGTIDARDIPYQSQDDSLHACEACMESLNNWDGAASLSAFRERFGFVH